MNPINDDAAIIAALRERSKRFVHSVFASFALLFAALALAAHNYPAAFSLPLSDMPKIASAFLFLAAGYTLTLFVWDWMLDPKT